MSNPRPLDAFATNRLASPSLYNWLTNCPSLYIHFEALECAIADGQEMFELSVRWA